MKFENIINIIKYSGLAINIILSLGLLITAFSGYFNPLEHSKLAVLGMTFPAFIIGSLIMLVIWGFFMEWRYFIIFLMPILVSWNEIYTYCPLNFFNPKIEEAQRSTKFSLLSYNVMDFDDFQDKKLDYSPTISLILKTDADMVCLQECYNFEPNKTYHVTKEQIDSIKAKYPYRVNNKRDLGFLSKFPIEKVESISGNDIEFSCASYKLLINNEYITIFNVHLKSIGLTLTDKELYMKLTSVKEAKENIDKATDKLADIKGHLYSKLAMAFRERARQAELLRSRLNETKGNIILCGDFNDTPNSYAYREIKGDMTDAYRECGFGPSITYHANRFYFRIDQVFYTGKIKAVNIDRIKEGHSDHYPLLTEFVKEQ